MHEVRHVACCFRFQAYITETEQDTPTRPSLPLSLSLSIWFLLPSLSVRSPSLQSFLLPDLSKEFFPILYIYRASLGRKRFSWFQSRKHIYRSDLDHRSLFRSARPRTCCRSCILRNFYVGSVAHWFLSLFEFVIQFVFPLHRSSFDFLYRDGSASTKFLLSVMRPTDFFSEYLSPSPFCCRSVVSDCNDFVSSVYLWWSVDWLIRTMMKGHISSENDLKIWMNAIV